MKDNSFTFRLPEWVDAFLESLPPVFPTIEDRMAFVIELSRRNVENKSGGPFGAAVFSREGKLIAPGVNLVSTAGCSILHAEMVAFALAQRSLNRFDLSDGGTLDYDLAASTEPCAMCFGATPWSGVTRLICGARDEDARAVGFDEGPKIKEWQRALESRGIAVIRDVLRKNAAAVLKMYADSGGVIYNSGKR